ncbi:MAG TPA: regulatory iron-sulfur-containing complex subunit RicT [Gemmatimonadales bacterium]|nr:regulatory iron-sulfur-containing complex subunit RicT [Gemmatimonadales bacterium]
MPQTVEVRFKGIRRDFFLWPDDQDPLRLNEAVIVECERGHDFGRVQTAGEQAERKCGGACGGCARGTADPTPVVADSGEAAPPPPPAATGAAPPRSLRPVLRRASPSDISAANDLRRAEEDIRRQAADRARQHRLEMKLSDAEWQWDRAKLTLFFTAEKRVDFRALVRELAGLFRTRIELRQIGVRDEAARLTGVGRCGREYCCSTWLTELSPVSLALAKDQHLSLNPAQISGGCGRLLCCLRYEHEFYVAARKRFPREGKMLITSRGHERVIAVDIFRERVFLRNDEGSRIIPLADLNAEIEAAAAAPGSVPVSPPPQAQRRTGRPQRADRPARPHSEPYRPGTPLAPAHSSPSSGTPAAVPPVPPASPAPPSPPPQGDAAGRPRRRRRGRRGGRGGGPTPPRPGPEA